MRFVESLGAGTAAAGLGIDPARSSSAKSFDLLKQNGEIFKRRSGSELTCDERSEAVEYDGVDVDMSILHIAPCRCGCGCISDRAAGSVLALLSQFQT